MNDDAVLAALDSLQVQLDNLQQTAFEFDPVDTTTITRRDRVYYLAARALRDLRSLREALQ